MIICNNEAMRKVGKEMLYFLSDDFISDMKRLGRELNEEELKLFPIKFKEVRERRLKIKLVK